MPEAGTAVVTAPNLEKYEKEAPLIVQEAQAIKVTSETTYESAGQWMRRAKTYEDGVRGEFKPTEDAQKLASKNLKAFKDKALVTVLEAISLVDPQMKAFQEKKRQIREEQERKAREAAEAKAKKEREEELKRLEAEQERERREHEKKMAALKKKRDAESKARAEELAAEEKKREEEREAERKAAEEAPVVVDAVETKRPIKKQDGVIMKQSWDFEIVDKQALLQACAAGKAPLHYIKIDRVAIGKIVRAEKGRVNIPGIKPFAKEATQYKRV